jgi:Domain of unknown function (DUF4180)
MPSRIVEINGHRLLVVEDEGPALARVQDMLDLIGEALSQRASLIVVPVVWLDPAFFRLRSGFAGEIVQKIVNYRLRLAVIGDIAAFTAAGSALADFVRESNRGRSIFFLPDLDALAAKLSAFSAEPQ